MKPSKNCVELVKKFEGLKLTSYKCPGGIWTIGYGTTRYEDGTKVKEGEIISMKRAEELLTHDLIWIAARLPNLKINQNQIDAVCSFCYNVGMSAFINSTMFKYMRANPNDELIGDEFMKWTRAGGKVLKGLVNRRKAEKELYFED